MTQKLIQTQTQKMQQVQKLSAQQMLQVKLFEMPLNELEENVNAELDDNPALERSQDDDGEIRNNNNDPQDNDNHETDNDTDETDYTESNERNEREDALDSALKTIGADDEMPEPNYNTGRGGLSNDADYPNMVYGDTLSFYDRLKEQMDMLHLSPTEHDIMEYLIGSMDDDGLLRKDIGTISDELAIYHNIDAPEEKIKAVLHLLQQFDPAGIGAQNLQQCLLLQIDRMKDSKLKKAMHTVIHDYFDDFIKKHWDKIREGMSLDDFQIQALPKEIRKLNPKPGSSLGETEGRNLQQITPDYIIDTADDGSITFSINRGNIPELTVSPSFQDMIDSYRNHKASMNRQEKEALLYAKEKVEKARGFIDAVKQRRHTMFIVMKSIINWQKKFFEDGDEADLRPMILKDIADQTRLDISTISRIASMKYAQTKWGTFPLKFFFSDGYTTENGEEMSTRKIKMALKGIVEREDKKKPMSDDTLAALMKEKGFPIARRTVAKYREQLGIPVARLRRE
ncbi:MAG: RNA polymerase factor sigma-54 [Prevotella sp.]|jgi:RNA polymerase sigma-54 factor|nr:MULTISPECIES: RNA polymerase factor sigma-54 [unclassified Prevotella]MCH3969488.1 RNA polymerase factor sigma-54 [Prevotella sp.]MCH4018864.1 RNA polymerase factor sigma-54 [Prevotella sp.]MCH4099523.1 RNA polymerase factor sigma-54 [Prevotella sp.]MCH4185753.1 RNA polymerase factor sigma-54 [Prevotella sp.]MCH4215619.1 RNA polymerase factor sigma-54 [Prevotella sp.]